MLKFDDKGYPKSMTDYMDSAVRAGILTMCQGSNPLLKNYIDESGKMRRHPTADVASNWKNCTRDQMIPLLAGFHADLNREDVFYKKSLLLRTRAFFWRRFRSLFFMQNTERDKKGSRKFPYQHSFYKDSNPNSDTYVMEKPPMKLKHNTNELAEVESREFDFADPLLPNHIWIMIKTARLYLLYPFALIGIPVFILTLLGHSLGKHNEENQMIAECYINGEWALKLYKLVNKNWKARSEKYWSERNEIEYHNMLVEMMEDL